MSTAPASAATALDDAQWMRHALALAEEGVGLASPNPTVGCVLVKAGQIVGRGFHQYQLRDHAEVVGLHEAGAEARGATAYVTLEPCSHHGRTPPCARALTEAGVGRVVVATTDANPAVHGQGIAMLREAGIPVTAGVLQEEARALNNAFARFIRTRLPFVTLKIASTLDGRIAPEPGAHPAGSAFAITGAAARAEVQRLRHSHDALLTGLGTVLADDPLLTDRSERPRRRPLLRVVLDSQLRLPLASRLVTSAQNDVLIITSSGDLEKQRALTERGIRILPMERQEGGYIWLPAVLAMLGEQSITSVLIEGGGQLNRSALLGDTVDRLYLFYAPLFLGGKAIPLLAGGAPAEWPHLASYTLHRFGQDFAVDSLLRDPWL